MAQWNDEYINPYAEHGKKSEQVKKITVSIPLRVLKVLTDGRGSATVTKCENYPKVGAVQH